MLRVVLGFFLVFLGLAYLVHPTIILRVNAWMRERVFRDAYVLLNNRRIGSVLLLLGFLLFASALRLDQ
jgi:hypothetical protein